MCLLTKQLHTSSASESFLKNALLPLQVIPALSTSLEVIIIVDQFREVAGHSSWQTRQIE